MMDSMNAMDSVLVDVERDLLPIASTPRPQIPRDNFPTRRHLPGSSVVAGIPPLEPITSDTSVDAVTDDADADARDTVTQD